MPRAIRARCMRFMMAAALAEFAQDRLGLGLDEPLRMADLPGDAEDFLEERCSRPTFSVWNSSCGRLASGQDRRCRIFPHQWTSCRSSWVLCVPPRSGPLRTVNVEIASGPALVMRSRPVPHPLLDVVAGDHEVLPIVTNTAHDQTGHADARCSSDRPPPSLRVPRSFSIWSGTRSRVNDRRSEISGASSGETMNRK